jgi:lysophospholipase L1-like esterase
LTISSSTRKAGPYPCNGVTTSFPFAFKVFNTSEVLVVGAVTASGVETTLSLGTNYTVALNADQNTYPGGTVTTLTAYPTGQTITLSSAVANTQGVDLTNAGGFYPEVINSALDRATIQIQQLAEQSSRTLKMPISSPASAELPPPAAGNAIGWNSTGTALINYIMQAGTSLVDLVASSGASVIGWIQSLAGSVPRTVQDKLRESVSVLDFGADSTGVADSTAAFNLAGAFRGSVVIPAGTYKISSNVTGKFIADVGVTFTGAGFVNVKIRETGDNKMRPALSGINPALSPLVLFGIDSLTNGSFSSTFRTHLQSHILGAVGDGGPGFLPFALGMDAQSFNRSAGVLDVSMSDGIYGQYALGGKGQYVASGAGGDYFTVTPKGDWDTCQVFYLQQPGGGSFSITPSVAGGTQTVSTAGTLGIQSITVQNMEGVIAVSSITGNVCIFSGLFLKNDRKPVLGDLGVGGQTLQSWAGQDSTIIRQYIAALNPGAFFINAGMNDRISRTSAQHYADLTTVVNHFKTACPTCNVVIIQSNEPSDTASNNFLSYTSAKIQVAKEKGCGFYDDRDNFGDYSNAVSNGLMADGVHPNAAGNIIKAGAYANLLGVYSQLNAPLKQSATAYLGALNGNFPVRNIASASSGVGTVVYTIGIDRGGSVTAKLRVSASRVGTNACRVTNYTLYIQNPSGNTYGQVGSASAVTAVDELVVLAGDSQTTTMTLTTSIVSGRLVITVTPTNFTSSFVISGIWECVGRSASGKGVIQY